MVTTRVAVDPANSWGGSGWERRSGGARDRRQARGETYANHSCTALDLIGQ